MSFLGYPRLDGSCGVRNYVLVIPGGIVAERICSLVRGTRTLATPVSGSGYTKRDRESLARMLVGLGRNPNVAAVIVHNTSYGAGYPELKPDLLVEQIAESKKPVELIDVSKEGGTLGCIQKGIDVARQMVHTASKLRREPCDDGHLALGVKCGSSDTTSGITGNPAVGYLFDKLVAAGGTVFFGENTEIIGAEHVLASRAASKEVAEAILRVARETEERAKSTGNDIRTVNPVPGNIAGGITTLEEKSLGAIHKAGSTPVQGVLEYAEKPSGKGLYFVDNWMSSLSIFSGYAAAGAQLVIYQLGGMNIPKGTILSSTDGIAAPLLWATGNPVTYSNVGNSIDYYSGTLIEGTETLEQAGERFYDIVLDIASGTMTRVETVNYSDPIQPYVKDPVF
jgi:altronate dehydratase large subunit